MAHLKRVAVPVEALLGLFHDHEHAYQFDAQGAVPADAFVVWTMAKEGQITVLLESPSFPWVPDGLPYAEIPVITLSVVKKPLVATMASA